MEAQVISSEQTWRPHGGHIEFFGTSLPKLVFWKTEARFSKKKEI